MSKLLKPEQKLGILQDIMAGTSSREGLTEKYKVSLATVDRLRAQYKEGKAKGLTLQQIAGPVAPAVPDAEPKRTGRRRGSSKYAEMIPQWKELYEKGMPARQIAEKFHVSYSMVSYHLHKKDKLQKSTQNGGQLGKLNRNVLIGVAWSETERFIGLLAQRFAFPPAFLRQRLSELLGSSPDGEESRASDRVPSVRLGAGHEAEGD